MTYLPLWYTHLDLFIEKLSKEPSLEEQHLRDICRE